MHIQEKLSEMASQVPRVNSQNPSFSPWVLLTKNSTIAKRNFHFDQIIDQVNEEKKCNK